MASCIPLNKEESQIVEQCTQAVFTAAKSKFGCTAIFHGMNETSWSKTAKMSKIICEKKYSICLLNGLNVSVWKDDLTAHRVDAVVNAANEDLKHVGGLALALAQAGGHVIQQESNNITKRYGKVPTGGAVVTSAGHLPCKKVIHAVGPHVSHSADPQEISRASRLLSEAIENIFKVAERENVQSVAVPAISSGIFNFPLDHCAEIIVTALQRYDRSFNKKKILDVHLVNNDDPTVSEMEKACKRILGVPKTYSLAVKESGRGLYSQSGSDSHKPPLKLNCVTLHIIKGYIEKQETSAIVNTTGTELNLSSGAVSKAILSRAGRSLQQDIQQYRYHCNLGDVLKTKGHGLKSSYVYHVLCAYKTPGTMAGENMLEDIMQKCLDRAKNDWCTSISFPAIGSGMLGFSKREVAQIMTKAVQDFSRLYKGRTMDVFFVIYPSEEDTFQAFAKEYGSLQYSNADDRTSFTNHSESAYKEMAIPPAPTIEFHVASHEVRCAAKRWMENILNIQRSQSVTYKIRNNHILHFGLCEHEKLLFLQEEFPVRFQMFFTDGQAGMTISGSPSDVTAAVLKVEAMCCKVQEAHALAEEATMLYSLVRWKCKVCPQLENPELNAALEKAYLAGNENFRIDSDTRVDLTLKVVKTKNGTEKHKIERICFFKHYQIEPVLPGKSYFDRKLKENSKQHKEFQDAGLHVVCVESVENCALVQLFELSRRRITGKPKRLYQRVPVQCCQLVSWVGFQRDYAPPDVQALGEGIYFSGSVKSAMKLWEKMEEEEYVYIIEADVLTGNDTSGSPDLIVPPPRKGNDALVRYDSVRGGTDTTVVFNGQQALPLHIYTCKKANEGFRV